MIRVVHPGSRFPDPDADFLPIPDPGSRGQKGTGSRIRNTGGTSILLKSKRKEAKIKNETFENQEQHSSSSKSPPKFEQQLIKPFEWLFAKSVRLQCRRSRVRSPTETHPSRMQCAEDVGGPGGQASTFRYIC
jgi:hypothetical protein